LELRMDPARKRKLVELIVSAGLEEDLMQWLSQQGYTSFYGKLDNVPGELLESYVKAKKLLVEDEDEEVFREALVASDVEPPHEKRNVIPARK
jgi:hypothetical protein